MTPDQDREFGHVLEEAVALQHRLPSLELVAVGGTAAAVHAGHRYSTDADHVTPLLTERFEATREQLQEWEGWLTRRVRRPLVILGERHGVQLGVRQLRRGTPLETTWINGLHVSTPEETLRIKAFLCVERQATRDFADLAALADVLGEQRTIGALRYLNVLYPGEGNQSCLTRLAEVTQQGPIDRDRVDLKVYKGIQAPYDDWSYVERRCQEIGQAMLALEMRGDVATSLEEFRKDAT